MKTKTIVALWLAAIFCLCSWAYTSTEDYNEEQRAKAEYCERVEMKVHTDYKGICDG